VTITLDGRTLLTRSLGEGDADISSEWDAWEGGVYVRKVTGLGEAQQWRLACFESATAYADSNYKHFRDKVPTGDEMPLVVTLGGEVRVNATVVLLEAQRVYDSPAAATANYRRFDLTVMEV
jgi:hypothetical protein